MFSCCRANPKASKKDKDKQHKKNDKGNDDDEGGDNATNEINEPVAAAAAVEAGEAQPIPTSESETEKETDAKPNGTISAKPTTESPQEIESENEERSEEHKDQTGIQNILKYIHTYILYILYNNVHSLRISSNTYVFCSAPGFRQKMLNVARICAALSPFNLRHHQASLSILALNILYRKQSYYYYNYYK